MFLIGIDISQVIWYIGCKHTTTTCYLTLFQFLFALVCTEIGKDLLYIHSRMINEIMSWQEKKTLMLFPIYLLFIHILTWRGLGVYISDMWEIFATTVFFHDRLMDIIVPLTGKNFNWFPSQHMVFWLYITIDSL